MQSSDPGFCPSHDPERGATATDAVFQGHGTRPTPAGLAFSQLGAAAFGLPGVGQDRPTGGTGLNGREDLSDLGRGRGGELRAGVRHVGPFASRLMPCVGNVELLPLFPFESRNGEQELPGSPTSQFMIKNSPG